MTIQRLTYLGFDSIWWASLIFICFLVAGGLIVRIYQFERKLVSKQVGWGLLSLRFCLLLLVLLVALQPTLSWTSRSKEQTKILVAFDVSESMDLVDDQATETERAQWAVGLGMIRAEILDTEREDFSDGQDEGADSRINLSRFELARQLMTAPKIGLLDRLDKISTAQLVLFSSKAHSFDADDLMGTREELSKQLIPETTSFSTILQEAAAREDCTAIILITDGVKTADEDPLEAANGLASLNRPVFSILAGSIHQPVDLAIESVDHPESVYKKDKPLIRVRVATFGYQGQLLSVALTDVATGTRISKEIEGAERYVEVEFDLPLETPGRQRFIVEVQPASSLAGLSGASENVQQELRLENNQQEFGISVIDDTSHVLLVDSEGRWEFRFLEAAFHRDERVDLKAVLFNQPYLGLLPHTFFDSSLPKLTASGNAFEEMDLVIWGDADSRSIEQSHWEDLEKFVAEKGGTLVVTAGKQYFSRLMLNPVMKKMLPIDYTQTLKSAGDNLKGSPRHQGFHLHLTTQGKQHPLMKLDTDSEKNIEMWRNLPGHFWGLSGDPKPGAIVLAKSHGAKTVSSNSDESGVVIVHNYGLGRVLWIGLDSTWRWRFRSGDRDHYRFWGQLSRWAAQMRSSAGSDEVRFGTDSTELEVGEQTTVRARWSRRLLQNIEQVKAVVEVYPEDENQTVPILTFPLRAIETDQLLHEAQVPPLPVGEYRLRLKTENVSLGPRPIESKLFISARRNGETNRLSADRSLLDQFASMTGGAVLLPHQMDELMQRLNPDTLVLEEKHDIPLWNHWLIFVMMMFVLAAEWLLRKWHGLP